MPKLLIACNMPVRDGMVVHTDDAEVAETRRGVMELLLVNHPLDCPICDKAGECLLQDYSMRFGSRDARTQEPRRKLGKRKDIGPRMLLDQERCILCRRCVRFCREITGTSELGVFNIGRPLAARHHGRRAARQRLLDLHRRHLPGRRAGEQGLPPQAARLVPEKPRASARAARTAATSRCTTTATASGA